jgi:flagellar assembly protein FliH
VSLLSDLLEDFDKVPRASGPASAFAHGDSGEAAPSPRDLLASYEDGYRSGWDDATQAAREAHETVSEELARNLQDIGFTYYEARNEILGSLRGLLGDVFDALLPRLSTTALADAVLAELMEVAEQCSDVSVVLRLSPEDAPALSAFVDSNFSFPFVVQEEEAVAAGQAYLDLGTEEKSIDVSALIQRLNSAVLAVADQGNGVVEHG